VEELIRSGTLVLNKPNASASENPPDGTSPGSQAATSPGSGPGGPGGGRPGRGGPGGGFDMGVFFERLANGRETINIADLQMGREEAQAWAQKQGITNGQLTRAQFTSYMQERMQSGGGRMGMGGGRGGRGFGPGGF